MAGAMPGDVVDYCIFKQAEGADKRTIAKSLSALRSLFVFCIAEGLRADNPAGEIENPKTGRSLPKVFSREDVDQFFQAVSTAAGRRGCGTGRCLN